jgi:hypothetical protein
MREYRVIIEDDVEDYFLNLVQFVAGNTTLDFALRYVKGIRQEIECLSYLVIVDRIMPSFMITY